MKLMTEPKTTPDGSVKDRPKPSIERRAGRFDSLLGVDALLRTVTWATAGRAEHKRYDTGTQTRLLILAAVVECLAGLAFILFPAFTIALLLGPEPGSVGLMIARVAGVALLALGVACAGAATEVAGAARAWTVTAITLYNAGAGLLLVAFAARGMADGPVVWVAGVLHMGLALAFATCAFANLDRRVESPPSTAG